MELPEKIVYSSATIELHGVFPNNEANTPR